MVFLAVNSPGSSEDDSLRAAAKEVRGKVQALTVDGADIDAIIKEAARPPVSRSGDSAEGVRWREAGWWLVPILVLIMAWSFRRESGQSSEPKEAAAASLS